MEFIYHYYHFGKADRVINAIRNKDYEDFMSLLDERRNSEYDVIYYYPETPYENRVYKDIRDREVFEKLADSEIEVRKNDMFYCGKV